MGFRTIVSAGAVTATMAVLLACSDVQVVDDAATPTGSPSATATVEASETHAPTPVTTADVGGMTLQAARDVLESVGLKVDAEGRSVDDPDLEGTVIGQSPEPGDEVVAGTEVTVTIARYTGPNIVDGPVTADASGVDWDAMLSDPPDPVPGIIEAFNGSGDDLVDFAPRSSAVIQAHRRGSSNFMVRAIFDDGSTTGVVNEIGRYLGEVVTTAPSSNDVVGLEIRADGPWAIIVSNLLLAGDEDDFARSYEGIGDSVVGFPVLHQDEPQPSTLFERATITHDGTSNFIVRELLGPGLVNEIGSYEGTVRLSPAGLFGFEVTADGAWSISLE